MTMKKIVIMKKWSKNENGINENDDDEWNNNNE